MVTEHARGELAERVVRAVEEADLPGRLARADLIITCRGLGKCMLKTVGGASRKGRVMIEIERYV